MTKPENLKEQIFPKVILAEWKVTDELSRAMKSSPEEMLNHIFTCFTLFLKWGVVEMLQEELFLALSHKNSFISPGTQTHRNYPPLLGPAHAAEKTLIQKKKKNHTNHRLESTWIFQCWDVWSISLAACGDSECGCGKWIWREFLKLGSFKIK